MRQELKIILHTLKHAGKGQAVSGGRTASNGSGFRRPACRPSEYDSYYYLELFLWGERYTPIF